MIGNLAGVGVGIAVMLHCLQAVLQESGVTFVSFLCR
jgi:hypothetical protein